MKHFFVVVILIALLVVVYKCGFYEESKQGYDWYTIEELNGGSSCLVFSDCFSSLENGAVVVKCLNKETDIITEEEFKSLKLYNDKSNLKSSCSTYWIFYCRDKNDMVDEIAAMKIEFCSERINNKQEYNYLFVSALCKLVGYENAKVKSCTLEMRISEDSEFLEPSILSDTNKKYKIVNNLGDKDKISWKCQSHSFNKNTVFELEPYTYIKSNNRDVKIKLVLSDVVFKHHKRTYTLEDYDMGVKTMNKNN